jgi:1-phosphofructokinase
LIYTCTLNPALDYKLVIDKFTPGKLNRSSSSTFIAGGKGINVSLILNNLKVKNTALGFTGGFTGEFIKNSLTTNGISHKLININQTSRMNIKLKEVNRESEINQTGPIVSKSEFSKLTSQIDKMTKKDILICGGSSANGIANAYEQIARKCRSKKIDFVMDISSREMLKILKYRPFLIKPNIHELGDYFQKEISGVTEAIKYGKKLISLGAQNLIISMGAEGSLLVSKNKVYQAKPIRGKVISTVGAGDSMVAGFIAAYMKSANLVYAYKMAVAAATATSLTKDFANLNSIKQFIGKVEIKEVV